MCFQESHIGQYLNLRVGKSYVNICLPSLSSKPTFYGISYPFCYSNESQRLYSLIKKESVYKTQCLLTNPQCIIAQVSQWLVQILHHCNFFCIFELRKHLCICCNKLALRGDCARPSSHSLRVTLPQAFFFKI